jgi:ligand-binding sensor domain-containing protein
MTQNQISLFFCGKKAHSLWLLGLLIPFIGYSQSPYFRSHVLKLQTENHFTSIFQDKSGWMWLGGSNGTCRYDGMNCQELSLPDSIPNIAVSAIGEFENYIWFGYKNGMISRIPCNTSFPSASIKQSETNNYPQLKIWMPEEGLPTKSISGFCADKQGNFWISTYGEGLYCWHQNRLYQFNRADEGLTGDDIYAIACDKLGRIWAATDGGISICTINAQHQKSVLTLTTLNSDLPDEIITALVSDTYGDILVGTYENGICKITADQLTTIRCTPDWSLGPVTAIVPFGSLEIWAGTTANGLICVNLVTGSIVATGYAQSLQKSKVIAACKNQEGLLWTILDKGAVYSSNVRISLLQPPFEDIQTACFDQNNRLWIGSKKGLYLKENDKIRLVLPITENILSIWEAPNGYIWVGTFGHGVFILDGQGHTIQHLKEGRELLNGSILSINGAQGIVWLSTLGGVIRIGTNKQSLPADIRPFSELGNSYVYKVYIDQKNRVWFGTDGKGLWVLENQQLQVYNEACGLPIKTVYSMAEDEKGNFWFASEGNGLFWYDQQQQFHQMGPKNHLHGTTIIGLGVDRNNMIMAVYEDGVDIINPFRKDHVAFYNAANGVKAETFNLNAVCKDGLGNIWIGARNGLLRINTYDENFLDDPLPGITGVSVFLQSIDFHDITHFSYDQNYFIFNFLGLWYTQPEAVLYKYRLDGFDLDWKISRDHLASYPNLPPGKYTFRVQTSEHGNFDHVPETTWSFTVNPPFWAQWWFVLLFILLSGAIFYRFITAREARLRREAAIRRESVEFQFAALKSQINPHFLFNSFNTLITIIEENPSLAVEYVEHLSDFYRSILVYREKDIISIQEELELVRNFGFLLKKRYEDNLELTVQIPETIQGAVMTLTLQMLVENAVKHNIISSTKPLKVEIFALDDTYIIVRNNIQRKIKPEPGTHFGLQSLQHRYHLLKGKEMLISDDQKYFTVKVPIIYTHQPLAQKI